jgi:hypothetical protein
MNPVIWTLAIVGPMCVAAIGTFIVFVIGIRKGDRGHLGNAPLGRSDSFARSCLSSYRHDREEGR